MLDILLRIPWKKNHYSRSNDDQSYFYPNITNIIVYVQNDLSTQIARWKNVI